MSEATDSQNIGHQDIPTPKQFKAKFKEIFDAETTFGSLKAARLELLESVSDIIQEYLKHDCSIVYLHGKLKEAGYSGSRKELSDWLFSKSLRTKREIAEKVGEKTEESENNSSKASESEEVSASHPVPSLEVAPTPTDNKNVSSVQNADQSVREVKQEEVKIPGKEKPNFAPHPRKITTVYSAPLNLNPSKS